jgi:uncharacterized Tic20 family protein
MSVTMPAATHMTPHRLVDERATSDERTYATLLHLTMLAHLHTGGLGIVVALIMWLIKRNESPFIDDHGREAMNFQISMIIYMVASFVLVFCGIGVVLAVAVYVVGLVGMIMAAMAAHRGEYFRYPVTIRFLH